jgi:exopolysaccharide biosynthesis polyprenyl glycosylphosphotransferase
MIPSKRLLLKHLAKIFDLSASVASFVFAGIVAYSSWNGLTFARIMGVRVALGNCLLFTLLLVTWHIMFTHCGLYVSKRFTKRRAEALEVFKATSLASAFLFLSARIFHIGMVDRAFLLLFWLCCTFLMISARFAAQAFLLSLRRRGKNSRFLLVVGTNERAIEFANQIANRPDLGYRIVGFVDDDWHGISSFEATAYRRCCSFPGLVDFLRQNVVDEMAIFLPLRSYYERAAQLVSVCEQHGIAVRFNSPAFNLRNTVNQKQDLDQYSEVLAIATCTEAWPSIAKRILDFMVSAVLLMALSPLLAFVALLIKCSSRGPLFFSQVRVGLNKRQFKMHKFRTMIANAEQMQDQLLSMNEMSGPAFKMKHDPRITALGRVLRKTSIDELPQLLNVLLGAMSLVGPRAMSLRDYQLFDRDWQRRRFSVKPGITCLWQIRGRNSIPFEKWMELDMEYIDKWSLWLDFKILAQTLPAVVRGTGAV